MVSAKLYKELPNPLPGDLGMLFLIALNISFARSAGSA
jgi:hypothetical protein